MKPEELKALVDAIKGSDEKPKSLFGIPSNYATMVILVIGILVYWSDIRGKSEFEVQLSNDITVLKNDVTTLKSDVSDIKTSKDADRQLINGISSTRYTREDHYEYARTQTEIDQSQWEAINELRAKLKNMD